MKELETLYSQESFISGKKYFHYGNYPYLFKFLDEIEKDNYSLRNLDEILVCACLSYDLDDLYHIVFNTKKQGYYLINGGAINNPEKLKKPIRIATDLIELFQCEDFAEKFILRNEETYNSYMENSFYEYEDSISNEVPKSIFPNKDLRLLYKEKYSNGYFTDHKEYNSKKLNEFIERVNIKKYIDINSLFESKPDAEKFLFFLDLANKDTIEPKYLYVEFYQSGYQGIVCSTDLDDETLATFLKYGLIYNKIDVPERIYKTLE